VFGLDVRSLLSRLCLFVCLFVCLSAAVVVHFWGSKVKRQGHRVNKCIFHPEHNSKTNDPKMFKLGIGNDLAGRTRDMFWVET